MSQRFFPKGLTPASVIGRRFRAALMARGYALDAAKPIPADLRLLDSGLDSLGFAGLVVQLESDFGYDPFVLLKEPIYPKTYGELVELYQRFWEPRPYVGSASPVLDQTIIVS